MTARSTLAVLLLLVGGPLAGCIGGEDAPTDVGATNETDFNKANPLQGQTLVAFEETNKTEQGVGGVDHHHDMWNGQSRIELFASPSSMIPYDARVDGVDYEAVAEFRPPDGKMIYEGTATVEFSVSDPKRHACIGRARLNGFWICTDTGDDIAGAPEVPAADDPRGGPSGLKLRYKHASTTNWIDVGPIEWGVPLPIKIVNPTETDMPHATSSGWAFQILSPNKDDATLVFTAKATIVRGEGDIPLWPGHPDFYADSCCRRVLEQDAVACDGSACTLVETSGLLSAQKLISYGTRTLHVWINISEVFAPNPALAPDVWFLRHVNSTGRDNTTDLFDKEAYGAADMEHYWVLPVDDNGMDSPYADGSKWVFALGGAFFKEGISCYGGCADWNAKYNIVVIATNEELPADQYHMHCIVDTDCPPEEGAEERRAVREA